MSKYLTIAEAQQKLPDLADELTSEPAIITKEGDDGHRNVGAKHSGDNLPDRTLDFMSECFAQTDDLPFDSLLETIAHLSDREFMAELKEGIRQADAGETISLENLKAELGFE